MKRSLCAVAALAALAATACSTKTVEPMPSVTPAPAPTASQPTSSAGSTTAAPSGVAGETETGPTSAAPTHDGSATLAPAAPTTTRPSTGGGAPDPGPAAAALVLAPEDTAYLTLTDWARIKTRLGAQELTSESLQTDRIEFWRAVPSSTMLLTDGALRAENSRLGLRYATTQDDVRWEVRWTGEDREQGLALRLRDDLDLAGLERAVADEVPGVEGAEVLAGSQLLLRDGATGPGIGGDAAVVAVLAGDAESQLVAPGCLSWPTALGVDATVEEQDAVVDGLDGAEGDLLAPEAWGIAATGRAATVTVVYPEGTSEADAARDAAARVRLAESWPTTESVGWSDAFGLAPDGPEQGYAVSDRGGRVVATLSYRVVNTTAAANVALAGLVPVAVCDEIDWLEEPTGL